MFAIEKLDACLRSIVLYLLIYLLLWHNQHRFWLRSNVVRSITRTVVCHAHLRKIARYEWLKNFISCSETDKWTGEVFRLDCNGSERDLSSQSVLV